VKPAIPALYGVVALFVVALALTLDACGGKGTPPSGATTAATTSTITHTTTGGGGGLTAARVAVLERDSNVIYQYCQHPKRRAPAAISRDVDAYISTYRSSHDAVSPGPYKQGKTIRQMLADLGGLLNSNCDKTLGAKVGAALAKG
jgi:hypothetical protein